MLATLAGARLRRAEAGNTFTNIKSVAIVSSPGAAHPNMIGRGYALKPIATGTDPLENPSGVITHFGLLSNGTRTEPDENTYLVLHKNPGGPTPATTTASTSSSRATRTAAVSPTSPGSTSTSTDPAHRITLLTPVGADGKTGFSTIDGSTWEPHTQTLLFTREAGKHGGVIEHAVGWPPVVRTLDGVLGRAATRASTPTTGQHLDRGGRRRHA